VVTLSGAVVCAACKPLYLRKLQEGVASGARYKGFWIRLVAKLIDGFALFAVMMPLYTLFLWPAFRSAIAHPGQPPDPVMAASLMRSTLLVGWVGMLIVLGYNTWMLGRFGATLGKMAISAKVTTTAGEPISYGRALGRSLMEVVSGGFTLYIGYIIAAFDDRKRALHDRVAGTLVVAK